MEGIGGFLWGRWKKCGDKIRTVSFCMDRVNCPVLFFEKLREFDE